MGASFSNIQVRTDDANAVAQALQKLLQTPAYVSSAHSGWVSVFCDTSAQSEEKVAKGLSRRLSAAVFLITVHDSDLFLYTLYEDGKKIDEYDSNPDYFEEASKAKKARVRGKAELLLPFCTPGKSLADLVAVLHPPLAAMSEHIDSDPPLPVPDAIKKLAGMAGVSPESLMRQVMDRIEGNTEGVFTFAEDQARAFAALLGMEEGLACASFGEIGNEDFSEEYPDDEFRLVGSATLPQAYLDDKLRDALSYMDFKKAREWINKGASVNPVYYGLPLLVDKAYYCSVSTLAFLLELGADPNFATVRAHPNGMESGMTALMEASTVSSANRTSLEQRLESLRLLLNAGSDVNAVSETGNTALKLAHGAINPLDAKSYLFLGPAMQAQVAEQSADVVQLLREAGAKE